MAVFSATQTPTIRLFSEKLSTASTGSLQNEKRKDEWLSELERMSKFLIIKSTAQQVSDGDVPVDTAMMYDRDGLPVLKFILDLREFHPGDIDIDVQRESLTLTAHRTDASNDEQVSRTKIRKFDIPEMVDPGNMHCIFENGFMLMEMPFHLPPKEKPKGSNVFPIITDKNGRKRLQLAFSIEKTIPLDTITCQLDGHALIITSSKTLSKNPDGTPRMFRKYFQIPENVNAEKAETGRTKDGRLLVELILFDEQKQVKPSYKCTVMTEQM